MVLRRGVSSCQAWLTAHVIGQWLSVPAVSKVTASAAEPLLGVLCLLYAGDFLHWCSEGASSCQAWPTTQ